MKTKDEGSRTARRGQSPPLPQPEHRRFLWTLAGLAALAVLLSGIRPWSIQDWLLENFLVLAGIPVLIAIAKKLPFSRLSWSLVFVFLCFHELGAHYTYSEVPYDSWWRGLFGSSLNEALGWQRNNFDRVIHFLYGLFLAYPVREIFLSLARVRGFWSYFFPLDVMLSSSALYELIEWAAASLFGGELGAAYVGTQGDPWDAQKDMALAGSGALLAMLCTAAVNWRCQRDFAREWSASLKVRRHLRRGA